MACGCVSQSSAIIYIYFIFYLHYSTYKNIFSIVDLPEAKPKVDFYPENLHIAVIPHFIAKPRVQNCTPRNRPFCSNRSRLTYSLLRLSLSGDIHPNPGPAAASNNCPKCPICERAVAKTHRAIECDICLRWCHIKCGRVSPSEYDKLQLLDYFYWNCPSCELRALPFADASFLDSNVDDDLVSEPDEDVFTTLKTTMGNNKNLKIGHININGLANKLIEIQFLLKEVEFDILGVTETHLTEDISNDLIRIHGYNRVR